MNLEGIFLFVAKNVCQKEDHSLIVKKLLLNPVKSVENQLKRNFTEKIIALVVV